MLITKIKSYGNETKIDFHDDAWPPEKTQCLTGLISLINSEHKNNKLFHPQTYMDECKQKQDKVIKTFIKMI